MIRTPCHPISAKHVAALRCARKSPLNVPPSAGVEEGGAFAPHHAGSRLSHRQRRLLLPTAAQPSWVLPVVGAVSLIGALPASIAIDAALDRATNRVAAIANAEADGVPVYVAGLPAASDNHAIRPAVVLLHQILGLQDREAAMCEALAELGYVTLAPNYFEGRTTTWLPRALALGFEYALKQGSTFGVPTVHKAVQWLKQQPGVDPQRIAVAGFCLGGGAALRYAAAYPQDVAACGVFYGKPLEEPSAYATLTAPVLGIYGSKDRQFPPETVDAFESQLQAVGVPHKVLRFPGMGHAFVTDLEATRQPGAAADAWTAFLSFLEQNLRPR